MPRHYRVISADGHMETPPDPWVKFVPKQYKDRAPRLIALPEGGEAWVIEGMPLLYNGQNIAAGRNPIKFKNESYFGPDGRPMPGTGVPAQRLREQDSDGIDAEVLFPPIFATSFLRGINEDRVYLAMVRAYNLFLAEFCSFAPDRLFGMGVIPTSGINHAVDELKECKRLGLKGVCFAQFPNGGGAPKPEDDLFWKAALEEAIGLAPHLSWGELTPSRAGVGTSAATFATQLVRRAPAGPTWPIAQMIAAGVFERFPDIRIYVAETNASWLPGSLWFMDDGYRRFKETFDRTLPLLPSEYVRRHFRFSFIADPLAMRLREFLPSENLMWGSDFPHSVGTFPNSVKWLAEIFEGVPAALKHKILVENPCEFFGIDATKSITGTPAA